jgi:hypothetical protein
VTDPQSASAMTWPAGRQFWRGRVVQGSAILLLSTGLVSGTNLLYNILMARMLGPMGFGHASALYTLLMLVTAVTFSFQIVTSKFIARNAETSVRVRIYATLLRRAWQVGLGVALLVVAGSAYLTSYLNLPAQRDLVLLAVAAGVYIPLGVRRGKMQGCYDFASLAINVVVEVAVKFGGALLFLHLRLGVTGVMLAILLSIVAAYCTAWPGSEYRVKAESITIAPFGEGMQAVLYFSGQVVLSNLDILLVKHFFPPSEAGIYAAVALVGRVVFMLSWSVVSSMFPVSASHKHPREGRSAFYTALVLVGGLISLFVAAIALAPQVVWTELLGKHFLVSLDTSVFPALLMQYAVMTGIYCMAVVVMMYEISRRIGTAAWVQLAASITLVGAIWLYHHSLTQVIVVQMFVMSGLLAVVAIQLVCEPNENKVVPFQKILVPPHRIRPVPEEEVVTEFLRGEFCHSEYDLYRNDYKRLVEQADLQDPQENSARKALLFRRRGRLWRELPNDTQWWEIVLTPQDILQLQSFPRNEWKRFTGESFRLMEMVSRLEEELASGQQNRTLQKLSEIACDLREGNVPNAVLLIGIDDRHPLTIIEGNHRMMAAMLSMPESAHQRFRFYCGFSPRMDSCCWHKTDLRSVVRFVQHTIWYLFRDANFILVRTLREKLTEIETG